MYQFRPYYNTSMVLLISVELGEPHVCRSTAVSALLCWLRTGDLGPVRTKRNGRLVVHVVLVCTYLWDGLHGNLK